MLVARLHTSLMAGASSLALAVVLAPATAHAACPGVIVNGETQMVTQNLANGETCVVEAGGAITPAAAGTNGIEATNNTTITNSGSITTTGSGSDGIDVSNNSIVINSGLIQRRGRGVGRCH